MGPIDVYDIPTSFSFGATQKTEIVDRLQRLLTVHLFLAANRLIADRNGATRHADLVRTLLLNDKMSRDTDEAVYKITPLTVDRDLFRGIIDKGYKYVTENYPHYVDLQLDH